MSDQLHQPHDAELLARVDTLLDGREAATSSLNALAETIRLLNAAAPVADPAFAQRLERQLAARRLVHQRRRFPHWVSVAAAATLVAIGLLAFSRPARLATAAALDTVQQFWLQVTGGPMGLAGLYPSPPFTARQFTPIPPDFALVGNRYAPGVVTGGWRGETQMLDPRTMKGDPVVQEALGRERGDAPHLVLAYRSSRGDYLFLYQRASVPDEPLPPGEPRQVGAALATLRADAGRQTLTWVEGDTWTELESSLDSATILALATTLAPIDAATAARIAPPPPAWGDAVRSWGGPALCDPSAQPSEPILGRVAGQRLRGTILLNVDHIGGREQVYPAATGFNDPDRGAIIDAAASALADPAQTLRKLPYPSIGQFGYDEAADCYRPAEVPGYLVIEVWEREVRIGYGGVGAERRTEALAALAELRAP